jgi:hypothetical protein
LHDMIIGEVMWNTWWIHGVFVEMFNDLKNWVWQLWFD